MIHNNLLHNGLDKKERKGSCSVCCINKTRYGPYGRVAAIGLGDIFIWGFPQATCMIVLMTDADNYFQMLFCAFICL